MEAYVIFWLAMIIFFIVLELLTIGLTSIWFAAGSIGGLIVAALGGNVFIQAAVFLIVSVVLICLTKPWAKKYINSRAQKTNVDSLIGKKTILTEDIDNLRQTGKAVVMGQEWTVRTDNDGVKIPKGTLVEVINVSGVKLIVKRINED